jgi:hypothetical protein
MRALLWLIAVLLFLAPAAIIIFLLKGKPGSLPVPKLGLPELVNIAILLVAVVSLSSPSCAVYPRWREHFAETGKRLPDEIRKRFQSRSTWEEGRYKFSEALVKWLGANTERETVIQIMGRLDAVLEFTTFVAREFLTGNYVLEKHLSDVDDQFQLHHLAMGRFVIVSNDSDFTKRISKSSQADRVMSFGKFLQSF